MRVGDFRADVVSQWVGEFFEGELHAKRIASLSDGVLGVLHSASLAVSVIGLSLAQAHGLKAKHAIKQVDRLLSNPGIDLGRLFTPWICQAIGDDREVDVAMDWTDFAAGGLRKESAGAKRELATNLKRLGKHLIDTFGPLSPEFAEGRARLREATDAYEECLPDLQGSLAPLYILASRRGLAECQALLGVWSAALATVESGLSDLEVSFAEAEGQHERDQLLSQVSGLGALGSIAALKIGEPGRGLELLERGRGVQLREALDFSGRAMAALAQEDPEAHAKVVSARDAVYRARAELRDRDERVEESAGFRSRETILAELRAAREELGRLRAGAGLARKTPSLAALLKAIPSGGALVAPFATAFGAFAFVVPEGTEAVTMENVVVLDGLDADDLRKLLSGWLRPYRRGNAVDAVHGRALARLAKRMAGMAAEESRKRLERIVERSRKRRRTAIEAALSSLLEELWDRRSVHIASDRGAVPQRRPLAAVDLRAQCPRRRLRHPPSP